MTFRGYPLRTRNPVPHPRGVMALALLSAACSSDRVTPQSVVSDSAGVRVVQNRHSGEVSLPPPVLSVRVGWEPADTPFQEITAGALLPDGLAIAFDAGAERLYLIDPAGARVSAVGAPGEGPGEFRRGEAIERLADGGFVVFDNRQPRLSRFDAGTRFVSSEPWAPSYPVLHRPVGVSSEDRLLWGPSSMLLRRDMAPGETWVPAALFTTTALGLDPDTVATIDFLHLRVEVAGRVRYDPFTPYGQADGYADGMVAGRNDRPEIRWLSISGQTTQLAWWDEEPRPVDDGAWEDLADAMRAGGTSEDDIARLIGDARAGASTTLPYYGTLHALPDGSVWVAEYRVFGRPTRSFRVLRADGTIAGRIEMPQSIRILDITEDRVLGIETDEWDVQAVAIYSLHEHHDG